MPENGLPPVASDRGTQIGAGVSAETSAEIEAEILRLRRQVADLERALDEERQRSGADRRDGQETTLRRLCDDVGHLAGILDLNGTLRHVNRVACALVGVEPSEVVGRPFWETPWWEHSEEERSALRDRIRLAAAEAIQFETTHRAPDGTLRNVEYSLTPIRGADGAAFCLLAEGRDVTARHEAERERRRAADLLDAVIRAAPVAIVALDLDGIVRDVWNPAAERMFGWSADEAVGRFLPTVPADKEGEFRAFRERVLSGQTMHGVDVRRRRRDGSPIDYTIYASPLHDAEGRIIGDVAVMVDITDRLRADEALRARTRELDGFFSNALDLLCVADTDGCFRRLGKEWETVLGYPVSELEGRSFLDYVHPDDRDATAQAVAQLSAQREVVDFTNRYRAKDGSYRWLEWRSFPAGKVIYAAARDVTARRHAEEALRKSEQRYRALVESQVDMVSRYTPDCILTYVNDAYCRFYGRTRDELIGHSYLDMVAPEYREATRAETARFVEDPSPIGGEYLNYRADGEPCWIHWVVRGIIGDDGKVAELQAVGRDITAVKKVEEELRQAKLVVESSPVVLFRWTPTSGWPVEYVSENVTQFGYTPGELLSGETPYSALVHPDDLERVGREVREHTAAGLEHFRQVYRLVTKDGDIRWVDDRTAVERDVTGRVTRYQGILIDITEQKRADDARQKAQSFTETVLEQSPYSMWVSDERGTMLRMNQAARDLLRVTDEDLVGKYNLFEDRITERAGAMPLVRRVFERGERVQFPLRYDISQLHSPPLPDASELTLDVTISPVLDAAGRVVHAIVQHQDITDRVRAEEALERVNRQLRMLSDCNQALVRATDELALLSTICEIVVQVGGYRMAWVGYAEDDEARTVRPMAHAGHEAGYLDRVNATWDESERGRGPTGTAIRTGLPCPIHDIAGIPVQAWREEAAARGYAAICALPIIVGDRVLGALSVYSSEPGVFDSEEVTHLNELAGDLAFGIAALRARAERERAEETLRASEERFRRLVLNSSDIIAATDEDGILTYVSGPVERVTGFRADELAGERILDFVHPDDAEAAQAAFADVIRQPGAAHRLEFRIRHRSGEWVWLEAVGTNLLDDAVVHGVVMNVRDISERKAADEERTALQNQLQQAMKMEAVGRLAGGVAHDFNNLLTAITGNIELAKMETDPADPLMRYLDEASSAGASAAALVRQLLAFSRRQIIEPRVLNLNELVDNLRRMLGRLIGEDVELRFTPSGDIGSVRVDPGQFEQVLVNLAINARDAMPHGGTLTIETANVDLDDEYCARHPHVAGPGPFVMLAVSDTGHGMSDEVKQRLFEPFFTTKPKGSGTGLGLATIFGAVKQAGGTVEVYSEVGKGTTFKIYLPRVPEPAEKLERAPSPAWLPRGTETILLVEDDAGVRDLALQILRRLGYRVLLAANGGEAFMLAEKHADRIDLLLTDVVMPGIGGRELAERLIALHPEMRVLFSSGYTEDVIIHHGVIDERVDFVGKPYSMQSLATKIRSVLDRERAPTRSSTGDAGERRP